MKIHVCEVVDKIKDLDRIINGLRSDFDNCADAFDDEEAAKYLEEYRDMILSREVNF